MVVLGIETSCDETAAAVVTADRRILSNLVLSQLEQHRPFGGVVPEVAARAHLAQLSPLIARAMAEAGLGFADLAGVTAAGGPGLIGGLIVGTMTAKGIAAAAGLPFLAINHLEAHALTARLTHDLDFPYLLLLVSGGHCQLLEVNGVGRYRRLGTTVDDAVGEAFDKSAKLMGLPYPGGPEIERLAASGDPAAFDLPRPMLGRPDPDFSFSGLKTAVRRIVEQAGRPLSARFTADLAASLQAAIADVLADRTAVALRQAEAGALVVAGGVAANVTIRAHLAALAEQARIPFVAPPIPLCTDNAAMIAWAGIERLQLGLVDSLDFAPRPRWPLDERALPGARA